MAPKRKGEGGKKGKGPKRRKEPEVQEETVEETVEAIQETQEDTPQEDTPQEAEVEAEDTLAELTQQDADGEETDHSTLSTQEPAKKRSKQRTVTLKPEQEQQMVEWLHAHPCLYDKGHELYKNTEHRHNLWEAQAIKLGRTRGELLQWYSTHRTVFSKLCNMATGSGLTRLSARKKYAWDNFQFLKPHIYKQASKSSSFQSQRGPPTDSVSPGVVNPELSTPSLPDLPSLPGTQTQESERSETPLPSQREPEPEPGTSTGGPTSHGRRRSSQAHTNTAVAELCTNIQSSTDRASRMEETLLHLMKAIQEQNQVQFQQQQEQQRQTAKQKWVNWLSEEILQVPDVYFRDVQRKISKILDEYTTLAQQQQQLQQIQVPPQQPQQFFQPMYQQVFQQQPQPQMMYQPQHPPPVQRIPLQQPQPQPQITSITPAGQILTQLQPVAQQQPAQPVSIPVSIPATTAPTTTQPSAPSTPASQTGLLADLNLNPLSNMSATSISGLAANLLETPGGSGSLPRFNLQDLVDNPGTLPPQYKEEMLETWRQSRQMVIPGKVARKTPRKGTPQKTDVTGPPPPPPATGTDTGKKIPPPNLSSSSEDEHYEPE